jgi:hypothetical protein
MNKISLDGRLKSLKPCRKCGCVEGQIHPSVGPHGYAIRCDGCGFFLGWLQKNYSGRLKEELGIDHGQEINFQTPQA